MKLILDTHLIADAEKTVAARNQSQGAPPRSRNPATDLIASIIEICSIIVLTRKHLKGIMGAFKRKGLRFPGQSPLFRELENRNKVVRPRASRIPSLSASELKTLRGKRHHDVTDDRHLIEAALAERAFIITRDPWLLEKRALFKTKLDIEVYPPEEVQAE